MIEITENGEMFIYQGNSGYCFVDVKDADGEPYYLQEGEYILFTVKSGSTTHIQKKYTHADQNEDASITVFVTHEDTKDMLVGFYDYDFLFVSPNSRDYDTFIEPNTFKVKKAVSKAGETDG